MGWLSPRSKRQLLLVVCLAAGCGSEPAPEHSTAASNTSRPNTLWAIWDAVRADNLSSYGYERLETSRRDTCSPWVEKVRPVES